MASEVGSVLGGVEQIEIHAINNQGQTRGQPGGVCLDKFQLRGVSLSKSHRPAGAGKNAP